MKYKYPWFRWAMSQSKTLLFVMLAKKSGIGTGDIKLVYLNLCEHAACNDPRGSVEGFDFDGSDCVWDLEEGTSRKVYDLLRQRHVIDEDDRLVGWNEEQGEAEEQTREERKREQTAERVRRLREKAKSEGTAADASADKQEPLAEPSSSVTQCNAVTHCNAGDALHVTPVTQCNAVTHRDNRDKITEIKEIKDTPFTPQGEQGVGEGTAEDCSDVPMAERRPVNTGLPSRGANASWWREFASLWDIWPNKQGKDAAWTVYYDLRRRKIDMPPLYVLRDKASAMIAQDRKFLAGYAPELKTWLREHRWNDEPCPPRDVAVPGRGRTSREQQMATDVERAAEAARRFEDFFEMAADEPAAEGVFA